MSLLIYAHSNTEEKKIPWAVRDTPCVFSIGYEGKTIDTYIDTLLNNGVKVLVDVRNNPLSRKPGFSKTAFRNCLEKAGIKYFHIPELGVPRQYRKDLGSKESYQALFEYYEKEILSQNKESIEKIEKLILEYTCIALTCFEADYLTCHRHKITEYLTNEANITVVHLS
jgi:uncharacterized protein (DUF488 family)